MKMKDGYHEKGNHRKKVDLKEEHAKRYVRYLEKRYGKKRAELFSHNA